MARLDSALLKWYLEELRSQGWRVISQTETTAEVERVRIWNRRGLIVAAVLLAIAAILQWLAIAIGAILVLIFVAVDYYVIQRPSRGTVTAQQAREAARLLEGEYQGE
jgi:hypothetical protein